MNAFTADWLALRETADVRARNEDVLAALLANLPPPTRALHVLDIGAGSGSNLRYLAPRLLRDQNWTLLDHDPALLAALTPPRTEHGLVFTAIEQDLAQGLNADLLNRPDLITASAFFDLVSRDWLDRLAVLCWELQIPLGLFVLTFDGRIAFSPQEPEDAMVVALFNEHMKRDKGFGPALGPAAAGALSEAFTAAGYDVCTGDSTWKLEPAYDAIQGVLLAYYEDAARDMAPARAGIFSDWARRRRTHVENGTSHMMVGHTDMFVRRADHA